MNKKEIIKHFYEVIVSENLLHELPQYISESCFLIDSESCFLIDGERKIPLGLEGMEKHLTAVKQTYPDYKMRILRQYEDGKIIEHGGAVNTFETLYAHNMIKPV